MFTLAKLQLKNEIAKKNIDYFRFFIANFNQKC